MRFFNRPPRNPFKPYPLRQRILITVAVWILALATLYVVVAFIAWQIRNPKANPATIFTYPGDVLQWHRLPTFQ